MNSECVSGHLNIFNWKVMLTILYMTIPITPVYTAILIVRKLTITRLRAERIMSENRKQLHAQLLKALTIQACLPIFFLVPVITYAIGQFGIYNHPVLEYSTFPLGNFIPAMSPVTSIYFVRPYRIWIRDKLFCRRQVASPSISPSRIATMRGSIEASKTNF
ncbi:hypothetical protein OSTOST_04098 [Ostertagia ostertagi]